MRKARNRNETEQQKGDRVISMQTFGIVYFDLFTSPAMLCVGCMCTR
ncbi:unnamed protein product, partial [Acanthocheilonema viteae]